MRILSFSILVFLLAACNQKNENPAPVVPAAAAPDSAGNFFPVTTFLRGEIFSIKDKGLSPLRKITGSPDSAFIKAEEFEKVFADFLSPVIDTANLKSSFAETKFKDETINSFTFTYDPLPGKEGSFAFTHWDVYVNPETGKVTRIYLVKNLGNGLQQQLTWLAGKWCKIVTLKEVAGKTVVDKEEKISWSYDE